MSNYILIIVESPTKCQKIQQYVGNEYKVIATCGHIRELKTLQHLTREDGFQPVYEVYEEPRKKKILSQLKQHIEKATSIILATDDDREGEAIAWHICDVFGLSIETTPRMIFHEITEKAIQNSLQQLGRLDINKIQSQQTRQILDLMVGFTISPLLWKYIARNKENSLSAGRCQTPALKLIVDNQRLIETHPGKKVYEIIGYFTSQMIPFRLKKNYETEKEMEQFLTESMTFSHCYQKPIIKSTKESCPIPLTTSRLQQMASNQLGASPKETMKWAQTLYEEGYITYMRTESQQYSEEFIEKAQKYIKEQYKEPHYFHENSQLITMISSTKDAHEAIRPTNIFQEDIEEKHSTTIGPKEKKLYHLIWKMALQSCMSCAVYSSLTCEIIAPQQQIYTFTCHQPVFLGWKEVERERDKEKEKDNQFFVFLQSLQPSSILSYKQIVGRLHIHETISHYTEAYLVHILEEKGIGRPSTFSMLIDKIQEREYVRKQLVPGKCIEGNEYILEEKKKEWDEIPIRKEMGIEKNKLVLLPLGEMVIDFIDKYFSSLFAYTYTQQMEKRLDEIAKGNEVWITLCEECYDELQRLTNAIKEERKQEYKIDDQHVYMIGKYGPIIKETLDTGEVHFKKIKMDVDIDIHALKTGQYTLESLIENEKKNKERYLGLLNEKPCWLKKGKYGLYAIWGDEKKSLQQWGNRPLENVEINDVFSLFVSSSLEKQQDNEKKEEKDNEKKEEKDNEKKEEKDNEKKEEKDNEKEKEKREKPSEEKEKESTILRKISSTISIRKGKYGNYIFYKTTKMKTPSFHKLHSYKGDYMLDDIKLVQQWISQTYHIS